MMAMTGADTIHMMNTAKKLRNNRHLHPYPHRLHSYPHKGCVSGASTRVMMAHAQFQLLFLPTADLVQAVQPAEVEAATISHEAHLDHATSPTQNPFRPR